MAAATPSPSRVGLVTGGASGMGLAVVEHLVREGWNVTVVDFNEESGKTVQKSLGSQVLFVHGNVISYENQAEAFVKTWEKWGRLDFVFANAGFGDRMDFCAPASSETTSGAPAKPDTLVLDVCLYGVVWTAYLAFHFFRKNTSKSGALVSTASLAGLYPAAPVPLYGAAKHGVVGLTRSLAKRLKEMNDPITVNCICPGLVPTPLVSRKIVDVVPKEILTPYTTIVRAIQGFIADPTVTGQVAECSGSDVLYRPVLPYGNQASEYMVEANYQNLVSLEEMMQDSAEKGRQLDAMGMVSVLDKGWSTDGWIDGLDLAGAGELLQSINPCWIITGWRLTVEEILDDRSQPASRPALISGDVSTAREGGEMGGIDYKQYE